MVKLNGKWKLDRVDKANDFAQILAISAHEKYLGESFLNPEMGEMQEIDINSNCVKIKFAAQKTGWNEEQNAVFGVPVKQVHFGAEFSAVYNLIGEELQEEQDGIFKAKVTRKVVGNEMVMDVKAGDAQTTRYYKRVQ